ncbi:LytR/AlgR family response regulator transcription factor [Portibacter lacus]
MIKLESPYRFTSSISVLPYKEKLCIATQSGHLFIKKKDISYLQSDSNYCIIHSATSKLICSQTLKKVSSRLNSSKFVKVHQSYVVNVDKIKFINCSYTIIKMKDDTEIPIARAKKRALKLALAHHCD